MNTVITQQRRSLRETISWKIAYGLKPLYFALRKDRKAWNITMHDLEQMSPGTLGNDVFLFLRRHKLKIMPRAEFHDVYHVLFEYETDIRSEACVQFVPLGNGRFSLPYVACTLVSAFFYPEFWSDFYKAFMRGWKAKQFHDWNFEPMLTMQTSEVRELIFGNRECRL